MYFKEIKYVTFLQFMVFPINYSSSISFEDILPPLLQPISGLGLLLMRFRNLTLIDGW
jgi:hypothetical protein